MEQTTKFTHALDVKFMNVYPYFPNTHTSLRGDAGQKVAVFRKKKFFFSAVLAFLDYNPLFLKIPS